ncbi:hypothetical protein [Streptomyces sp. NPDC004726]
MTFDYRGIRLNGPEAAQSALALGLTVTADALMTRTRPPSNSATASSSTPPTATSPSSPAPPPVHHPQRTARHLRVVVRPYPPLTQWLSARARALHRLRQRARNPRPRASHGATGTRSLTCSSYVGLGFDSRLRSLDERARSGAGRRAGRIR